MARRSSRDQMREGRCGDEKDQPTRAELRVWHHDGRLDLLVTAGGHRWSVDTHGLWFCQKGQVAGHPTGGRPSMRRALRDWREQVVRATDASDRFFSIAFRSFSIAFPSCAHL